MKESILRLLYKNVPKRYIRCQRTMECISMFASAILSFTEGIAIVI